MENIPNLEELLNYGEEYQYPDLIMSDYFRIDNTRKKENKNHNKSNEQSHEQSSEQQFEEQQQEQSSEHQSEEQQEQSSEQQSEEQQQEQSSEHQSEEQHQEQRSEHQSKEQQQEQSSEQQSEEQHQDQSSEQQSEEQQQEQSLEQQSEEQSQEQSSEQQSEEQHQEQSSEQQSEEQQQEQSSEKQSEEQQQEQSSEQQSEEQQQEQSSEQQSGEQQQKQSSEQQSGEQSQEQSSEQQSEEQQEQSSEQQSEEQSQEQSSKQDENNFDNLMNNYDEHYSREQDDEHSKEKHSASDKLDDITATKIYKVLKKLVSLSYERYQKGTYKYDKKEIVKHYLTNQKFKIIDDLVSPTFKPDVYVFDLSPSNNESLEMYVNAISSVAIKNSLIYLTYNDCILRKLLIKKENAKNIDVSKIVNSEVKYYNNFECTIFNEYRSLYEELRDIKDRKIYIFSDFDISRDISRLSQENQDIVWFSTEKNYGPHSSFQREYPSSYMGYYVETFGIEDVEKFIREKNKDKYKRRFI